MLTEPWRISLLGTFELRSGNRVHTRCRTAKMEALLGYLAWNLGQQCSRETLADKFWPDSELGAAQTNVRVALASLRNQLEPAGVQAGRVLLSHRRTNISLNPEAVTCDVAEFRKLIARRRGIAPEQRQAQLMAALELYGGELMPGHLEEVVDEERNRLSLEFVDALQELSALVRQSGDLDQAISTARKLVEENPYQEDSQCSLMNLLTLAGRHGDVLKQYEAVERLYANGDLSDLPARVRSLRDRAAAEEARLTAPAPPSSRPAPPPEPSDDQPEQEPGDDRIEGGAAEPPVEAAPQPPPATPGAETRPKAPVYVAPHARRAAPPPLLPLQLTRFFGREEEIARLDEIVSAGTDRLITLTGTGGAGKTRLAVEFASHVAERGDHMVAFVPLAEVTSGSQIPSAIATAVRLQVQEGREVIVQIEEFLSRRAWLLVLDNLEQVSSDARFLVLRLLQNVATLTMIATSRHALDVVGEQQFPVEPLPVPKSPGTPERLLEFACVQLFLDRATKLVPDLKITPRTAGPIARLCEELEGLPLSIELAAGWAAELAPQQMVARLANKLELLVGRKAGVATRHSSLMASLEWSYRLVPPDLQRSFAALSVFRRGWTLDGFEAVCGAEQGLRTMADLRGRSLVTVDRSGDEVRYGMLEIVREFAAEKLTPGDVPFIAARHSAYFARLASDARPNLQRADQTEWLERLDAEHDNLRAALRWCTENDPSTGLRMAHDLFVYWTIRGLWAEGRGALDRAAGVAATRGDVKAQADLVGLSSAMAVSEREIVTAVEQASLSVALWRQVGDRDGLAVGLTNLGRAHQAAGAIADAMAAYQEGLTIAEETGNGPTAASALTNIAAAHLIAGDLERARETTTRALELHRAQGNHWAAAVACANLGDVACERWDADEAWQHYGEALPGLLRAGDLVHAAQVVGRLAAVALYRGCVSEAATLCAAAAVLLEQSGIPLDPASSADHSETVSAAREALEGDVFASRWADGAAMDPDELIAYVRRAA